MEGLGWGLSRSARGKGKRRALLLLFEVVEVGAMGRQAFFVDMSVRK